MNTVESSPWWSDERAGSRRNAALLGRLGVALEDLYTPTLSAPLPVALQCLVARLGPGLHDADGRRVEAEGSGESARTR